MQIVLTVTVVALIVCTTLTNWKRERQNGLWWLEVKQNNSWSHDKTLET